MRNTFCRLTVIVGVIIFGAYACDQPTTNMHQEEQQEEEVTPERSTSIEDQYIVVFKDTDAKGKALAPDIPTTNKLRSKVLSDHQIQKASVLKEYNVALKGFSAKLDADNLEKLKSDKRVDYIEKDQVVTLAPPCGTPNGGPCEDDGGGDEGDGQVTPWGINRVGGASSSNGTAWILDTGVDLDHPDLNVDTELSAVFVSRGPGSGSPDDGNGHGTHVAGTIAALDNDQGVVGVAAGASVVGVKVLDNRGSGSYSDIIAGIDYVASNASSGDVANMSLGGGTSEALDDAVRNAADQGIYFAVAAGNDGADANNYSPARVEYNNVWTISATDESDGFASFSNWSGPTDPPVEYAAPGAAILSLWSDGGTNTISGTSMASPHAAGVLLLTGGNPSSDGNAINDPDGDADPIIAY